MDTMKEPGGRLIRLNNSITAGKSRKRSEESKPPILKLWQKERALCPPRGWINRAEKKRVP